LRPLVLNKLPEGYALTQAFVLSFTGLFWLYFIEINSFLTGLAGLILYNFVYTRLKSITILAIIPGAISGAIPPYIGWLAGGGELLSLRAFLPVVIMIFWQIPHFFLVLINHKSDYINNQAPNILRSLSEDSLKRITLPWVAGLTTAMFSFAIIPPIIETPGRILIIGNGLLLFAVFSFELLTRDDPRYNFLFQCLNMSIFFLMLIVCLNSGVLW